VKRLNDRRRRREHGVGIAAADLPRDDHVVRPFVVELRRAGRRGLHDVRDDRQRIVRHVEGVDAVLGGVPRLSDDDG
jgi:hypothetical protein